MITSSEFTRFPKEWKVLPFLDVFNDVTSKGIKVKKENYDPEGTLPVVDQGKKLFGGFTDIENKADVTLPAIIFGDHTKIFKLIDTEFAVGADGVKLLEPKVEADKKFLFFYLNQLQLEDAGYSRHFKFLKETYIPLPPLETQKQIAAVLEKADQLRKDCKLLEQELNSLAQSVFIEMFGDNFATTHHTLGDVASVVSGVTKGQKFQNQVTVTAPYMRVANVQAGYLNLNEIKSIEVKESDLQKYKLEVGDVLLTEGGDHDKLGRGAIWNGEVPNCIHQNHVFRVRLNTKLYTCEWFNGYLKTTYVKRYFLKCAKKTTNLASINITQLKSLPMPDVTMERQKKFEHIITSINQQLSANLLQLNDAQDYFNVLMQKAFSGELNLANAKT
ncbi:restriction endonuclease subunit S [Shewanella baltica]|uniref:restriction endonuclease subunit S n=1 Tax=Shewanella baltica TaxID=62322 RepID=UPI003D7ACF76